MDLSKPAVNKSDIWLLAAAITIVAGGLALGLLTRNKVVPVQLTTTPQIAADNPLSPAARGLFHCFEPNEAAKTCTSFSFYKDSGDGTWENKSINLIHPDRPLTLEIVMPLYVKEGKVCGVMRPKYILESDARLDGSPIHPEALATIRSRTMTVFSQFMGKEACNNFFEDKGVLMDKVTMEGLETNWPAKTYKWISPNDGYRLAPSL